MKNAAFILMPLLLLGGCTTVKYEPKAEAGPAKSPDQPIYVYSETMRIPRPYEVMGKIRVGDTPLTVVGGSLEGVLETLRKNARQKGADALQLTSVEQPGFTSANYRVEANFLRFTDIWESVSISEEELVAYFGTNTSPLDAIEGVWAGNDPAQSRIMIVKNNAKPGREFIAFVVSTRNPSWRKGDKKLDIVRGERQGVYRGSYYMDDYQEKRVAITLRVAENRFLVHLPGSTAQLVFTKADAPRQAN